jgi:hypothetical protein
MRPNQEQSGGDGAVNAQAGRDVVVNGITASDALEIADSVFWKNFLTLGGAAEDVLRVRVERIVHDFVGKLQAENPAGLNSMADPDMLKAIYAAQEGYACSGEEDLEKALIDLLVDRAGQTERDFKTHVLNQAIVTLPKLTSQQRAATAVLFFVNNSRYVGPLNLASFYSYIRGFLVPFVDSIPIVGSDIGYMQYTGVGSLSITSQGLEVAFASQACGYFSHGFTEDVAAATWLPHLSDSDIFIPCIRDSAKTQINARSQSEIEQLAEKKDFPTLLTHASTGRMQEPEIKADLLGNLPSLAKLFDNWDRTGLSRFMLNAVGIAIGHACQRKVVGSAATTPLEVFLM